jgi:hypothetical protein
LSPELFGLEHCAGRGGRTLFHPARRPRAIGASTMQYLCRLYPESGLGPDQRVLDAPSLVEAEREVEALFGDRPVRHVELWSEGILLRRGRPIAWLKDRRA